MFINLHLHELADELKNIPWDVKIHCIDTTGCPEHHQPPRLKSCQVFILPIWNTFGPAKEMEEVKYWLSKSTWVWAETLTRSQEIRICWKCLQISAAAVHSEFTLQIIADGCQSTPLLVLAMSARYCWTCVNVAKRKSQQWGKYKGHIYWLGGHDVVCISSKSERFFKMLELN